MHDVRGLELRCAHLKRCGPCQGCSAGSFTYTLPVRERAARVLTGGLLKPGKDARRRDGMDVGKKKERRIALGIKQARD